MNLMETSIFGELLWKGTDSVCARFESSVFLQDMSMFSSTFVGEESVVDSIFDGVSKCLTKLGGFIWGEKLVVLCSIWVNQQYYRAPTKCVRQCLWNDKEREKHDNEIERQLRDCVCQKILTLLIYF